MSDSQDAPLSAELPRLAARRSHVPDAGPEAAGLLPATTLSAGPDGQGGAGGEGGRARPRTQQHAHLSRLGGDRTKRACWARQPTTAAAAASAAAPQQPAPHLRCPAPCLPCPWASMPRWQRSSWSLASCPTPGAGRAAPPGPTRPQWPAHAPASPGHADHLLSATRRLRMRLGGGRGATCPCEPCGRPQQAQQHSRRHNTPAGAPG